MQRLFLVSLAILLLVALIFNGCAKPVSTPAPAPTPAPASAPAPAPVKPIELKLSYGMPPIHQQHKDVYVPWAAELEKRTEGKVKVKLFGAASLLAAGEAWDGLLAGVCEIANIDPRGIPGYRTPMCDVFELPFLIPHIVDKAGRPIVCVISEKYIEPLEFKDVKVLWVYRCEPNVLHTVKKPIRKLEDMEGMVVGCFGGKIVPAQLKVLGASPEQIGATDMYLALERGLIDAEWSPMETQVGLKINEVVKYATMVECGGGHVLTIMNPKTWASLPPDIQKIMDEMKPWIEKKNLEAWRASTANALRVAKEKEIEIIELSSEERERWVKASETVTEAWIEEWDAKGQPASKIVNGIKELLSELGYH